MPKLRPDQYLSLILFSCIWFMFPTATPLKAKETIVQKVYEPLPVIEKAFLYPSKKTAQVPEPLISAKAAIIYDPVDGAILYEKHESDQLPQASLTKLMTAIVALEYYNLDEVARIQNGEEKIEGNVMYLKAGENITVGNLMKGLLIYSSNDAATALAYHYPGGYQAFIDQMNIKAQKLHLQETQFKNPTGFDENAHFSSAYDLAILSKEVLSHPELAEIMQTEYAEVQSLDGQIKHPLRTTNLLLHKLSGVVAGKTGSTPLAGECLIAQVEREGHPIITVVLGSQDRFTDTTTLVEWVYNYFDWKTPLQPLNTTQESIQPIQTQK